MATESETVMRNGIWPRLKVLMVLAMPVIVCLAARSSEMRLLRIGLESMVLNEFGTREQQQWLEDRVARDAAVRDGTLEYLDRMLAFRAAVDAQRRLAQVDEELADGAIQLALRDREERRGTNAPGGDAAELR